ncbi:MAG: extracellular solute-binding protein [Dehalococcoidia bacterium]|nr:extracellular solute-binding protein [Dehalococcoidia bacterium]
MKIPEKRTNRKRLLLGMGLVLFTIILVVTLDIPVVKARIPQLKLPKLGVKNVNPQTPDIKQLSQFEWVKLEAAARREGRLTLYSWSWTNTTAAPITSAFARRYGIEVDVVAGRGPQFLERLELETRTGNRIGDIMEGAQTHLRNAKLAGFTVSALDLPVLQSKENWSVSPLSLATEGHVIGYAPYLLSPYINTSLISPSDEPKSWLDLLQPRWKGKMVMPNPATSTVPYYLDVLIKNKAISRDYPSKLAQQQLLLSDQTPDSGELLGWGQASLSVLNAAPDMIPPLKEGGPIKAIDMEEGILSNLLTLSMLKNSPHPNAAKLFLNWLLSPGGQELHSKAKQVGSMLKGKPDYTPDVFKLTPKKVIPVTADDGQKIASAFREKTYVPIFSPVAP